MVRGDFSASETNACACHDETASAVRRRRVVVPSYRCTSGNEQSSSPLQPLAFTRDPSLRVNRGTAILIRHHHRRRRRRYRRHRHHRRRCRRVPSGYTTLPGATPGVFRDEYSATRVRACVCASSLSLSTTTSPPADQGVVHLCVRVARSPRVRVTPRVCFFFVRSFLASPL